jgi:hypothetical protein
MQKLKFHWQQERKKERKKEREGWMKNEGSVDELW